MTVWFSLGQKLKISWAFAWAECQTDVISQIQSAGHLYTSSNLPEPYPSRATFTKYAKSRFRWTLSRSHALATKCSQFEIQTHAATAGKFWRLFVNLFVFLLKITKNYQKKYLMPGSIDFFNLKIKLKHKKSRKYCWKHRV